MANDRHRATCVGIQSTSQWRRLKSVRIQLCHSGRSTSVSIQNYVTVLLSPASWLRTKRLHFEQITQETIRYLLWKSWFSDVTFLCSTSYRVVSEMAGALRCLRRVTASGLHWIRRRTISREGANCRSVQGRSGPRRGVPAGHSRQMRRLLSIRRLHALMATVFQCNCATSSNRRQWLAGAESRCNCQAFLKATVTVT